MRDLPVRVSTRLTSSEPYRLTGAQCRKNSQEMWAGPVRCNDKKLRQLIRENSIGRKLRTGEYYLSPGNPIYYVA